MYAIEFTQLFHESDDPDGPGSRLSAHKTKTDCNHDMTEDDRMTDLIGMLMIATLGFVAAFGWINARETRRMIGKSAPSTLSKDSPHWRRARGLPAEG